MTRCWYEPGKPAQMPTLIQASGQFRSVERIRGPPNVQVRHERRADPGNNQPGDGSRFRGRGLIAIMPLPAGSCGPHGGHLLPQESSKRAGRQCWAVIDTRGLRCLFPFCSRGRIQPGQCANQHRFQSGLQSWMYLRIKLR